MVATKLAIPEPKRAQLLEVIGRMDGTNSLTLVQAVDQAILGGRSQLILDFSGVEYMNSAGLRELVLLFKRIKRQGGALHIANPTERVNTLLELVGLDTMFEIHSDFSWDLARLSNNRLSALNRQICYCS
jgi:anti-sigma B factor antagonist